MELSRWRPECKLVVPVTRVERPRFAVIDAHAHLGQFGGDWERREASELIDVLDESGVKAFVDLDGGWGEDVLDAHLSKFKDAFPQRFIMFAGVDWDAWPEHGNDFGRWAAARLEAQVARGAQGLKIWKPFGLTVRDHRGELVAVDDVRLDELWAAAARLHVPVLIHVADPVAFFDPMDERNEHWEILNRVPEWWFGGDEHPSFDAIIGAFARLVRRHRQTTWIGAHVGCYAENLAWVGDLMDECPNFFVDISARIHELGRQSHHARKWFVSHSDRILFGTDVAASVDSYRFHYRFLETDDDAIASPHGRWFMSCLDLPDDVLRRVYHDNAASLLRL